MHGEAPRRVKKEPSNEQQQQQQPSPSKQTNNNSVNAGGSRREMFDSFHMWALKTYGDSAKTKTVTRKKYARIMKILKGEEQNSAENSKFRFWVKAKGFRIGPPVEAVSNHRGDQVLYVPCVQTKNPVGKEETIYKKVAVVENFFDIIYNVHVEMDGRGGKHAGQKRTYKAIAETFAFLPREAVTKFLMQCADCQKRMHAGSTPGETHSSPTASTPSSTSTGNGGGGARNPKTTANTSGSNPALGDPNCLHDNGGGNNGTFNGILNTSNNNITGNGTTTTSGGLNGNGHGCTTPPQIDFSLPITTTYLKHMRSLGYSEEDALNLEREVHFDENQFEMGRLDRKKKLRPNATPTLFGDPTDEEQPSKRRRKQPLPQKTAAASATEDELPESGLHEEKGGQGDDKVSEERGRRRRRNVRSVYGTLSAEKESPKKECTSIVDSDSRGSHSTPPGDSDCSPPPQIKEEAESPSRAISPCIAPVGMRTSSLNGTTAHFSAEHSYDKPVNMTKAQVDVVTSSPVPLSSSPSSSCPPAAPATPSAVTPVPVTPSNGWQAASASPLNMSKNGDVMITRDHAADARSLQDHTYDESVVMMVLPSPRAQSPCSGRLGRESTATPEDLSGGNKDEDDDEDDDNDDKLDIHKYDPERLKAFNMFVRLFVDENLDRMVPISKQPKEKIQAIIDSCNRQFPEFAERARKRIRTYLKSCRRTKRTRDQNGWDLIRPTPPHLTSAMAEQILAAACENESHNAKRMRLGLEPISATIQAIQGADKESSSSSPLVNDRARCSLEGVNQPMDTSLSPAHGCLSPSPSPLPRASPPHLNGALPSNTPAYPTATALNAAVSPTGHSNGTQSQILRSYLQRPTDLSLKKPPSHQSSTAKCNLNPSEVLAVKQLIAGYRESAAFLIRSADELEQLLLQQN